MESEKRTCPCNYGKPCHEMCTCKTPISSYGCDNCCTYGNLKQRELKAKQLKSLKNEVEKYKSLINRVLIHCSLDDNIPMKKELKKSLK